MIPGVAGRVGHPAEYRPDRIMLRLCINAAAESSRRPESRDRHDGLEKQGAGPAGRFPVDRGTLQPGADPLDDRLHHAVRGEDPLPATTGPRVMKRKCRDLRGHFTPRAPHLPPGSVPRLPQRRPRPTPGRPVARPDGGGKRAARGRAPDRTTRKGSNAQGRVRAFVVASTTARGTVEPDTSVSSSGSSVTVPVGLSAGATPCTGAAAFQVSPGSS